MNLKQFEAFLCVATLKSFRKTAEFLNTSQPAISIRVADLEHEIGARLFERGTSHVSLTPKGHELIPYAEKVLASVDAFRIRSGATVELSGVLRLGVVETIVQTWLPDFLHTIYESCPALDIEIVVDITDNLKSALMNRSLDMGFVQGPISELGIENIPLATYDIIWVASPKLGFKPGAKLISNDLLQHRILTHARNTSTYVEVYRHFRNSTGQPVRIVPSGSLAACASMVVGGIGIGALPRPVVEGHLKKQELIELKYKWIPSPLEFTAAFPLNPFHPASEHAAQIAKEIAM